MLPSQCHSVFTCFGCFGLSPTLSQYLGYRILLGRSLRVRDMVLLVGLEPTSFAASDLKADVFTNFTIRACGRPGRILTYDQWIMSPLLWDSKLLAQGWLLPLGYGNVRSKL